MLALALRGAGGMCSPHHWYPCRCLAGSLQCSMALQQTAYQNRTAAVQARAWAYYFSMWGERAHGAHARVGEWVCVGGACAQPPRAAKRTIARATSRTTPTEGI